MGKTGVLLASTGSWAYAGARPADISCIAASASLCAVSGSSAYSRIRLTGGSATECSLPYPAGSATAPGYSSSSRCSSFNSSWVPDLSLAFIPPATGTIAILRPRASPSLTPGTGPGKGGGLLDRPVIEKVSPGRESEFDLKKKKKLSPPYRVLLHNDNFNRREYVVQVLMKVIPGMTVDSAVNIMQEAHINGLAVVIVCAQNEAEDLCQQLRANGLVSSIEPASEGGGC